MTNREQEIMFGAFFDELGQIEKTAMLQKAASGELEKEAGWFGTAVKGFKQVGRTLSGASNAPKTAPWQQVQNAWNIGRRRGAGLGRNVSGPVPGGGVPGSLGSYWGGVKSVSKLPVARAAMLTGGVGAAGLGAAHLAGRMQGGGQGY